MSEPANIADALISATSKAKPHFDTCICASCIPASDLSRQEFIDMAARETTRVVSYMDFLRDVAQDDVNTLIAKDREYGGSWCKRGGIGAFMMLARKWDRLELQASMNHYDIFELALKDAREEGVLDDIGDLRRYLMLVEAYVRWKRYQKP